MVTHSSWFGSLYNKSNRNNQKVAKELKRASALVPACISNSLGVQWTSHVCKTAYAYVTAYATVTAYVTAYIM